MRMSRSTNWTSPTSSWPRSEATTSPRTCLGGRAERRVLVGDTLPISAADTPTTPPGPKAFLDDIRRGAISADSPSLHSQLCSGITIKGYQLEPVVRALRLLR